MKTTSKILVSMLGAIFIFSSLGAVYAVDPTPSPSIPPIEDVNNNLPSADVLWHESGCYAVWLILQSWGITLQYGDVVEWSDEVRSEIETLVIEYLESLPSPISIFTWVSPWLWDVDFWGNARFNSSMLEDVEYFANWLRQKFGLNNNGVIVVNPVYSLQGNYTIYSFDTKYALYDDNDNASDTYFAWEVKDYLPGDLIGYFQLYIIGPYGSQWQHWAINDAAESIQLGFITVDVYGEETAGGNMTTTLNDGPSSHGVYYEEIGNPPQNRHLHGNYPVLNGVNEYNAFFNNLAIVQEGNLKFVTSIINLPITDPNYNPGDSITIVDGKPEYSLIEWDGTVVVSNLPAIVSTGSIPVPGDELNPGLVNAWHPISTLIEMTADSMGMLIGIVYEFPEEVLIPIFAVLGGIIIFGIIHAMKEH